MLGINAISRYDATRILSDVAPERCFWVNNGPILHNIYELSDALLKMEPVTFSHHVNKDKNDIANWVFDVLQDKDLAAKIRREQKKGKISSLISKRIKQLEKICS